MADLLLEMLSEEIPANMQRRAADQLRDRVAAALKGEMLIAESIVCHSTPRRLTLVVEGLPPCQPDTVTERRGPRVGSPERAVQGFLKSVGLTLDQVEERELPKGTFYYVELRHEGRPTAEVLARVLPETILGLGWPKSMRWADHALRWVRPLHSVLCLFDGEVMPIEIGHLTAGDTTRGHRFLAPEPFAVENVAVYQTKLAAASVVLDHNARRETIRSRAEALAAERGLRLRADEALLEEVTGLVELPVVLLGTIDTELMDLPPEVLVLTLRHHQKYFSLETADGEPAPFFVVVSNISTTDGGERIVRGNERVLRARLKDAAFFVEADRKQPLERSVDRLDDIVFNARLGEGAHSVRHKVDRMVALAPWLARHLGADPDLAHRAALLAKADLVSEMVAEFPELQGIMGGHYARADGEPAEVVTAMAGHYAPRSRQDGCPREPVSITVSLADRLDTLVGFFAIGEKPTGSKDPFALRRTALGLLRTILDNRLRLPLRQAITEALSHYPSALAEAANKSKTALDDELFGFLIDRLEVFLRDQGLRHDLINAVLGAEPDDDLTRITLRAEALRDFLASDDGGNLLLAYRRASNIVGIEEKRDATSYDDAVDPAMFEQEAETRLAADLDKAIPEIRRHLEQEAFVDAMARLATLRRPVDDYLDHVTVNATDPEVRRNRLRQLATIRTSLATVADFSKIED